MKTRPSVIVNPMCVWSAGAPVLGGMALAEGVKRLTQTVKQKIDTQAKAARLVEKVKIREAGGMAALPAPDDISATVRTARAPGEGRGAENGRRVGWREGGTGQLRGGGVPEAEGPGRDKKSESAQSLCQI